MKFLVLAISLLLLCEPLSAKENASTNARARATLYQAEIRAVLTKHQWHIAAEASGTIVADHTLLNQGASTNEPSGPSGYTRAVITLKPKSATDTACRASVLDYRDGYYMAAAIKKFHGHPPQPSDPETVKAIEKIINEARNWLLERHPEMAPSAPR